LMPVSAVSTNIDPAAPMAVAFYRAAWVPGAGNNSE
jgi:hypothetical protein